MTLDEARSALGVSARSSPAEVRDAYLRRVRANHPDVTEHPLGAGERTATIISAYRLLRDRPADTDALTVASTPAPPTGRPSDPPDALHRSGVEVISDEAIWIDAEGPETGRLLLEVAETMGEMSYVDLSSGLVQVTVRPAAGPTCWLTVSIHPRPGGTVLVTTLESIEAQPAPAPWPLVQALADELTARLADTTTFPPKG